MGLGGILILLLLLVSLIVFIYVLVVSARGWGWLHSILLSFLFIECWVLIVFSAGVHYRRVNATQEAAKNRADAEQALELTQTLLWGTFNTAITPQDVDAVVPAQGMLRRLTADRGRVWRQLNLVQAEPGSYQLEFPVPEELPGEEAVDPLAEDPAVAPVAPVAQSSESLPVNTVVYAFAEQVDEEGRHIPNYYLGEFVVKESQAGQVKLQPTTQLFPGQQQRIDSGAATSWTLYELLPLDSHDVFVQPGAKPSEEAIFGAMDEEAVRAMFAEVPTEDGRQEELIESYLRDGTRAAESDAKDEVWVQVNVLKEYALDVDSKEIANATARGFFDASGRSIDLRLKRGEEGVVTLTPDMKGERIILKEEVAMPLINSGVLELVQRVYVRPLVDFEEAFAHTMLRQHEIEQGIELAQRDQRELEKANQLAQEMISFRQAEAQEISSDLGNYQREVKILQDAVARATSDFTQLRAEIQRLYQQVQAHHSALLGSSPSDAS